MNLPAQPIRAPRAKRAEDVVVAVGLLAASAPLFVVAYGLLAVDRVLHANARGPWLYRERRVSSGREFDLLKFRTLRDEVLGRVEGHARPHEADEANLTWSGRLLKRWYLDELPQLVHVLRGEMSAVGPRPWPTAMVAAQVAQGIDYRLRVRAGWTGPAQVSKGRAEDTVNYETLDLEYVNLLRTSGGAGVVRRDLGLLAETVRVLARGEGLRF